jgi:hypothetical protein
LPRLRIVASTQLRLRIDDQDTTGRWDELPETTRVLVLALLARLIAKGALATEEGSDD